MKTTVGRTYRFRAIHSLPDFPEPWCHPHEHDYTVEIEAEGDTPTDVLDAKWSALNLNGCDMNTFFSPSTVERIASSLLEAMSEAVAVTVWEDRQRWGRAER